MSTNLDKFLDKILSNPVDFCEAAIKKIFLRFLEMDSYQRKVKCFAYEKCEIPLHTRIQQPKKMLIKFIHQNQISNIVV